MPDASAARQRPFARAPVGIAAAALLAGILPGAADLLSFDRARVLAGEWWRPVTGQLVHWDVGHLLWNLAGAGLLAAWFHDLPARHWVTTGCAGVLAVALGLLLEPQPLDQYRGLSGLLYGWLVSGVLVQAQRDRAPLTRAVRWTVAATITLWALAEALELTGSSRVLDNGTRVHGTAHICGIAGALLAALAPSARAR